MQILAASRLYGEIMRRNRVPNAASEKIGLFFDIRRVGSELQKDGDSYGKQF